ncbi:DNA cytosine methyltransferase [Actinacidiphila sp. bgisy144]|uniref:DNA cytosine methyltransferase n=1 Tax=Actinacidiphila sp. bgisy144 TaxID=3413791 RepID=UPI003EBA3722
MPAVAIEGDRHACARRRAAGLATVEGDVRKFSPVDFPHANVLVAGPPCQVFRRWSWWEAARSSDCAAPCSTGSASGEHLGMLG